ncbi:unnamed protein product [Closterium sp. NIES-53]
MVGEDEESDYEECAFAFFSPVEMPGELATLKEALESCDAEEWKKVMESELKSIEENGTWELVELPEGRKAITSKWLFKIKSDVDGKIERYKSRLVAKGYQQKEKVDYKELLAPMVKPTTLRTLLAGAAIKGWVVKQMDVTTASLNAVLEEEIFMAQPEGFDDGSGRVIRLKKALYGLKQAPRQWYLKLRGVLEEIGFTPSSADHSLFMLGEGEQRSFMVVYVDDILIFSPSSDLVKEVMLKLQDKFKCKALGDVSFYLGLHIERDVEKRCMRVHQRKYQEALAANFGQSEGHVATPFPSGFKCVKGPEEESVGEEERRRFHSLVGSLMYAAVNIRPDVAFATGQLARVVQCPNEEQVAAGMRVAKYLGQTQTVGLQYSATAQRRQKGADIGHERYFLLVVDDHSHYTTVFPLRRKDRGGEISSDLLRAFCRAEGIRQTFTLPASLQQNGIAERRIGMVMDVARTSMIHAAAPHFLWPFAVQYAAHQINLQPHVSLPETTPTLRWTGKVGNASVFRVWGSRAFVRDASADKLSSRAVPCVFLGFPLDAPGWQFYHPTSRRVLSSQDITFDESVSYYHLFPYRTTPLPPLPLFLAPGAPPVDPLPPQGPAPSGVSQVDPVEPVEVAVDSGAARGAEPTGAGTGGAELGVAESEGAEPGGAELERVEPGGAEPGGAESGGAEPERAESGGPPGVPSRREPLSLQRLREWYAWRCSRTAGATGLAAGGASGAGAAGGAGGAAGAGAAGAASPGGAGARGTGAVGGPAGVGAAGGAGAAGPGGARTGGTGAAGAGGAAGVGVIGAGAVATGGAAGAQADGGTGAGGVAGVEAGDPGAEGTGAVSAVSGGVARPRPYYIPLLQQVLGLPPSSGHTPHLTSPLPVQSQSQLQPASPLPGPSPYSGPTRGLMERREPESRPASPESRPASPESRRELPVRAVCTGRRVPRQRPPPAPGTHYMTLRPSTAPQHVPLPSRPASSLPDGPDPESDSLRAASPTVTRFLATAVTDLLFESTAASALVAELVDFVAACRLDYAASLVAESESASVCPPSVGGECALGTDVLEDRQEEFECFAAALPHLVSMLLAPEGDPDAPDIPTQRSYAEAIEGPYSSQWQTAMETEMASWKSRGTYVDEVPPPGANIVSGMWIFRVKRPPGSPPAFKARYVARGFSRRQGVDFFHTFSPTPKMTTLRVLLHVAAQRDYELHSLDFCTAFQQGSLHEEIWLCRKPGFTRSFPAGTQWSLRRPVYGLRQAPREWHDTLRMTLAALGFAPSIADPSLFLRTDTTLPPFYVLVYVDDLVFATADTEALAHVKSELQKRHTCTDLDELTSYLGLRITRDRAQRTITLTQSHIVQQVLQRFGFTYSSPQSTPLPTGHSLSAPPSYEFVEPSGPYPKLVGCLMYLMTCTRPDLAYPLSILARYVAPGRHKKEHMDVAKRVSLLVLHADASWADDLTTQQSSQGYTFSLGSGSVSWRSTCSSSILCSSCEAEIYAGAMAAQELRWLTYLLTDLGEPPRSPLVLYVKNKAMIALCQENRLEHRTKHIALRYFLARELQQRGPIRLAYVATRANTADVLTKALQPCDLQRFCTVLGLVPTVPHLLTS